MSITYRQVSDCCGDSIHLCMKTSHTHGLESSIYNCNKCGEHCAAMAGPVIPRVNGVIGGLKDGIL